jgi:NADPH-dependent 7-cyano-7-deazaguanine reductase QueF
VDKLEGKAVTILVKDKEGRIVNREHIAKYKSNYHGRFDFSEQKMVNILSK